MKVRDLMTEKVETLDWNDSLSLAEDIMNMRRIRHLPVVDDDRLVGIISQRDLFHAALSSTMGFGRKAQRDFMKTVLVKEAMTDEVVTIGPEEDVKKAARIMLEKKIGCLPVVKGEKLIGLISESDLVCYAAES